jgi:2-amino-4-hydroxy-6-hydroxymethyldihydropteridine diphosphokinase
MRAVLGLGSNLGERGRLLTEAIESLDGVIAVSSVYETEPVGGPGGQGAFLNLVVVIDTSLSPRQLLGVCHRLESAADRVRVERWGPRTLDVDILWIDGVELDEEDLQIPHPRMWHRRFVMEPLVEVAPDLAPPDWQMDAHGDVRLVGPLSEAPN